MVCPAEHTHTMDDEGKEADEGNEGKEADEDDEGDEADEGMSLLKTVWLKFNWSTEDQNPDLHFHD